MTIISGRFLRAYFTIIPSTLRAMFFIIQKRACFPHTMLVMICKDKTDLKLGDETCTIFLNTICTRKTVPEGLSKLFRYISNMECCDDDLFISELHERVRELNTAERRKVLHTLEDKINERYRAGFSEGKDAGFSEGEEEKAKETALAMISEGLEVDLISRVTGLSREEIEILK